MIFHTYKPSFPLDRFVDRFFYYEGYDPAHRIDRFLPDGNVELIIDLDDRPKFIYDNDTLREKQTCRRSWFSGVRTEPISIYAGKASSMFIVYFKKGAAYPFFPVPMNEIADTVVDAELLWGESFAQLHERLLGEFDLTRRFQQIESFLLETFSPRFEVNPCVEFAVRQIVNRSEQVRLRELTRQIGYSQKHFISMFKSRVGVTPKSYLKLMRFQKAVGEIEKLAEIDWTTVAQNCGFYDQAHFINDFKLFSGFTPAAYAALKSDFLNYVPVG